MVFPAQHLSHLCQDHQHTLTRLLTSVHLGEEEDYFTRIQPQRDHGGRLLRPGILEVPDLQREPKNQRVALD